MYNYNNPGTNQDCVCLRKKWGLQSKPRLVCLLWGDEEAEVRVAHYPLGTQNKQLLYFGKAEVHVA